jgi:hypothetical protein
MKQTILIIGLLNILVLGAFSRPVAAPPPQAATPTLPPLRAEAYDEDVNVRAGPGTEYERVGTLVRGQSGGILGQAQTIGVWLKIVYIGGPENTGWVSQDVVRVIGDLGLAPTVVPPPTPTLPPAPTSAITVTEAAVGTPVAARLPTFTASAPVVQPTLLPVQGVSESGNFPPAIIIISLFVLGGVAGLISLLRRR